MRLRPRPLHPSLNHLKLMRKNVITLKMRRALGTKSQQYTMPEFDNKDLKTGKARDPNGLSRDILRPAIIGANLKVSLLYLCNLIKESGSFPSFIKEATIATIPINGTLSQAYLSDERGIFLVSVLRNIFMRMAFN